LNAIDAPPSKGARAAVAGLFGSFATRRTAAQTGPLLRITCTDSLSRTVFSAPRNAL
jgi:hypothetical protein